MSICVKCGVDERTKSGACRPCRLAYSRSASGRAANDRAVAKFRAKHPNQIWLNRLSFNAKAKGLPFNLTAEDFVIPAVCPLLGVPLAKCFGRLGPFSPSADKIIPELGYVKGNVRIISQMANMMKQNATPEQLLTFAKNLPSYLKRAEK